MMLNLSGCVVFAINEFLAVLGALSGFQMLRARIRHWLILDTFFRIFTLSDRKRLMIVCPVQHELPANLLPTTHHDLLACADVVAAMVRNRVACEIKLPGQLNFEDRKKDLFLICGPAGNAVTADLLAISNLPFHFVRDNQTGKWAIEDRDGALAHAAPEPNRDFGIIAKINNPWDETAQNFVYIAAGIGGLGTLGAARFMVQSSDRIFRTLPEGKSAPNCFAGIIESKGDVFGMPQSTHLWNIRPA